MLAITINVKHVYSVIIQHTHHHTTSSSCNTIIIINQKQKLIRLSLKLGSIQAKVIPLVLELVLIILPFFPMIIIMTVYMIETIKIMTELIEAQVAWIGIIVKCRDNLE